MTSRCIGLVVIIDLDLTDDIALLSEEIWQAQELLKRVKTGSLSIGLKANAKKTKCQVYNQPEPVQIATLERTIVEAVNGFKYLGNISILHHSLHFIHSQPSVMHQNVNIGHCRSASVMLTMCWGLEYKP